MSQIHPVYLGMYIPTCMVKLHKYIHFIPKIKVNSLPRNGPYDYLVTFHLLTQIDNQTQISMSTDTHIQYNISTYT